MMEENDVEKAAASGETLGGSGTAIGGAGETAAAELCPGQSGANDGEDEDCQPEVNLQEISWQEVGVPEGTAGESVLIDNPEVEVERDEMFPATELQRSSPDVVGADGPIAANISATTDVYAGFSATPTRDIDDVRLFVTDEVSAPGFLSATTDPASPPAVSDGLTYSTDDHLPESGSYGGRQVRYTGISVSELAQAIAKALSGIKVYVLESDITQAQGAVKAAVELSKF